MDARYKVKEVSQRLLTWYDTSARVFPWRKPPGTPPHEPYKAWLAEVMLQQTTTTAVIPYYEKFLAAWPHVDDLAAAEDAEVMEAWAGLGYYARARNMLAAARALSDLGHFPKTSEDLIKLPGFGPYTSAAVAAISFGERVAVVDGNVKRVFHRLRGDRTAAKDSVMREAVYEATPASRPGDFAQAVMDLGATVCKPRAPKCDICPLSPLCLAHKSGEPEGFPEKQTKKTKPVRTGKMWVIQSGHEVLTVKRPDKGLLGGTLALPSSGWDGSEDPAWDGMVWEHAGDIKHVFTHFEAHIAVYRAELEEKSGHGWKTPREDFSEFPTLMRKALKAGFKKRSE